jgi:SAM-dependent methyltransferase
MQRISEREQVEAHRSAGKALHTEGSSLRIGNTERYRDPSASTPYPLEYCHFLLGDVRGKTVLDLGCGSGDNAMLVALRGGGRVYALDLSRDLIELAKRRMEVNGVSTDGIHFLQGSGHYIGLRDESVDVVIDISVLHHLDLALASTEIYRILRKGGQGIFQEPVRDSGLICFIRDLIPYKHPDVSPFERPLTTKELTQFSERFSVYHNRSFDLPHVSLARLLAPRFLRAAIRLDGKLLAGMPFLDRFSGIKVFQLTK